MTVSSPFSSLPVAPAASRLADAPRDPATLLFIGYGSNGRLRTLPDSPFVQVGFTSAEVVCGTTPSGAPAHCVICSGTIDSPMDRAAFRSTMSKLISMNQERARGTSTVTAAQMATYFARIMAQFKLSIEQFRPLESREEVQAQIAARSAGRTRTSTPAYDNEFDFTTP
jgi:hypothetical protein